jgi:putative ABC transport system permease protein
LLRLAARVVPSVLGVEGRLAVRHLQRQRGRTGLTVGVLFAAVTACIAFGMSFLVNLRDIDRWYAGTVDADFLVRAAAPDPGMVVPPPPLPASANDDIRQLPGCEDVSRFVFLQTRADGAEALLIARDFPKTRPLPLVLDHGAVGEVRLGLSRGEAVLGRPLARRLKVGVGDEIIVPGRDGPRRLRVAGLAKEYAVGGMVLYVEWEQARAWLGSDQPQALAVAVTPGEVDEFGADLADYCAKHGLLMQRNRDFAATIDRVVVGVRWFVVGLVGLIFLVAAVGVVNTLWTNVLDQTRELGVLRALGMKRGQVQKLVLAQAATLALVSCVPGAPAGVLLAYLMNLATPGLLGHVVPFHVEGAFLAACVAGVAALAVVAALLPARRAARLLVVDALRYE